MILADTGFFVALVVRTDRHHRTAVAAAERYDREGLLTTWPVLTETVHLVQRVAGVAVARSFLEGISAGAAQLFELGPSHLPRMVELMHKYEQLPMDLADASLVICAEEIGDGRIFSTDNRDFAAYRWKTRKPFKNLLGT
jgi:predicted nucleic acid-binding protein